MKVIELEQNFAGGVDLITERDSGNVIRILTGRPDLSLEFWQRLKDTCDRAIDFLESRDENKDTE